MKIRFTGTLKELLKTLDNITGLFDVVKVSANRSRKNSSEINMCIEIK